MHQERDNKHENKDVVPDGAVPSYLLDRSGASHAKVDALHNCCVYLTLYRTNANHMLIG
jgi:hypothetical protein